MSLQTYKSAAAAAFNASHFVSIFSEFVPISGLWYTMQHAKSLYGLFTINSTDFGPYLVNCAALRVGYLLVAGEAGSSVSPTLNANSSPQLPGRCVPEPNNKDPPPPFPVWGSFLPPLLSISQIPFQSPHPSSLHLQVFNRSSVP